MAGAAARQHGDRALVVDVHERADVVRPSAQALQSGGIVCLHEAVFGADVSHQIAVELRHHLGQRGKDDGLAGGLEPRRDRIEKRLKQRRALGADRLAEIDGRNRRLVGDAEIEIAPGFRRPVEQHRTERQFACALLHRYLHRLPAKAPCVSRLPSVSARRLAMAASRPAITSSTALRNADTTLFT